MYVYVWDRQRKKERERTMDKYRIACSNTNRECKEEKKRFFSITLNADYVKEKFSHIE